MNIFIRLSLIVSIGLFFAVGCKKPPPPPPPPPPDPYIADVTPVEETFRVNTTPSRASVTLSTGETCTSPCSFKKMSTDTFDVTAEKSGYRSTTVTVISHAQAIPGSGESGKPKLGKPKLTPNPLNMYLEPNWKKR